MLQHEAAVGSGNLAAWLDDRGIPWRLVDARSGEFPEGSWSAVVVLGSEASAYDDSLDWLRSEKRFLRPLVERGVPVLGLCFGAQLLALLTGGQVRRAAQTVRGWTDVDADDDVLAGRWLSWHGDEILAPPRAVVRARSATCLEAFRIGRHLGLQYHPEVTAGIVDGWSAQDFGAASPQAVRVRVGTEENLPDATAGASRIYDRFFTAALTASDGLQR
ncbi:type 1 glutamine amidotransferase [Naasia sp. SYSU D00948]|uniref:type 1 glutamine amidotransferase n=1 Tax=Naasia sp. SYSU D00948 TaxID=2817379 RepID=UPI001B305E3D|nr:type 1 glutamine amidotransferase [Naasia sp. SYSU D00948]